MCCLSLLFPVIFFSLQPFLPFYRNSRTASAQLSPMCAVEQADAPAEVERGSPYHVWTNAVIFFFFFTVRRVDIINLLLSIIAQSE